MDFVECPIDSFAQVCADRIVGLAAQCIEHRQRCHLAFSGGSTPNEMFDVLATRPLDWSKVEIWQVDERIAADQDPARNSTHLLARLVNNVPTPPRAVHLIDVALPPQRAAAIYQQRLLSRCPHGLDVVHLGLGEDGHTASWPPNDPICDEQTLLCTSTAGRFNEYVRISLTPAAVNRAADRLVCVAGPTKREAFELLQSRARPIPAHHLTDRHTTVMFAGLYEKDVDKQAR